VIQPTGQFAGRLRYDTPRPRPHPHPAELAHCYLRPPRRSAHRHAPRWRAARRRPRRPGADLHRAHRPRRDRRPARRAAGDPTADAPPPRLDRAAQLQRPHPTNPSGTQPCQCPPTLKGRWQAAKAGHGCEPLVHVALQLAADPTLGRFLLSSATWMFADHAMTVKATLRKCRGAVCTRLAIDRTPTYHHRRDDLRLHPAHDYDLPG
jgi:hypothetical protein